MILMPPLKVPIHFLDCWSIQIEYAALLDKELGPFVFDKNCASSLSVFKITTPPPFVAIHNSLLLLTVIQATVL
jgi:hypothetical protein